MVAETQKFTCVPLPTYLETRLHSANKTYRAHREKHAPAMPE